LGQYWLAVNLDKKEFIMPHKLGCGLKLWEQIANHPSTGTALLILTAAMPEQRGGGDLDLDVNWHGPERTSGIEPGQMPEDYQVVAHRTIGRWAGDRIAVVGDYAEREDLAPEHNADIIYTLCGGDLPRVIDHYKEVAAATTDQKVKARYDDLIERLKSAKPYTDITDDVCKVIEHELHGKFVGEGWREFVSELKKQLVERQKR